LNIKEACGNGVSIGAQLRSFLTMFGIVWGITGYFAGRPGGFSRDQKERLKTIESIWRSCGVAVPANRLRLRGGASGATVIQDAYIIKKEGYLIKTVSPELWRSVAEVSRYNAASRPVRSLARLPAPARSRSRRPPHDG
jgi:putative ABC transport system permease protein